MHRLAPFLMLSGALFACSPATPTHEIVLPEEGSVRIPISVLDDGSVHFFTFVHAGRNVNFLVRTDERGVVHAHLDACYACYRYRRGFVVEDGNLVCIACRLEYAISDETWDYIGACAPIALHSSLSQDHLIIDSAMLERAGRYF